MTCSHFICLAAIIIVACILSDRGPPGGRGGYQPGPGALPPPPRSSVGAGYPARPQR